MKIKDSPQVTSCWLFFKQKQSIIHQANTGPGAARGIGNGWLDSKVEHSTSRPKPSTPHFSTGSTGLHTCVHPGSSLHPEPREHWNIQQLQDKNILYLANVMQRCKFCTGNANRQDEATNKLGFNMGKPNGHSSAQTGINDMVQSYSWHHSDQYTAQSYTHDEHRCLLRMWTEWHPWTPPYIMWRRFTHMELAAE